MTRTGGNDKGQADRLSLFKKTLLKPACVFLIGLATCALLSGCASFFAKSPMDVAFYEYPIQNDSPRRMIVFLRGLGGSHQSFEQEGFVADVLSCGLAFDMAAPNAHFGYYGGRSLMTRLKEDVIKPAQNRGCKTIWLVGVSMGGLGAMLYLMDYPEDIAGVYLIAPFLGGSAILKEIEAAGGLTNWHPGPYRIEEDWERMFWHWIQKSVSGNRKAHVYLGYGSRDPYKPGAELLAAVLPPERVTVIDGAHDYATFKALWKRFLADDAKLRGEAP